MISSLANFPVPNPKLKGRNLFRIALLMAGVLVLTCTLIRPVFAVEGGKGFYLLYSVIAFDLFIRKQFNHIGGDIMPQTKNVLSNFLNILGVIIVLCLVMYGGYYAYLYFFKEVPREPKELKSLPLPKKSQTTLMVPGLTLADS